MSIPRHLSIHPPQDGPEIACELFPRFQMLFNTIISGTLECFPFQPAQRRVPQLASCYRYP